MAVPEKALWGCCGTARGCLWPQQNPVCSEVFRSLCHVPPKRFKLCAGVRGRQGRGCAGGAGKGVGMRGFLPKVTADSDGSSGGAPESRSCAGAASPVLLLVCNFSKYRPSNLFLSQERIRESATGINPFLASPATELSKGHLFAWGWKSFVPKKIFQRQSWVTQLF